MKRFAIVLIYSSFLIATLVACSNTQFASVPSSTTQSTHTSTTAVITEQAATTPINNSIKAGMYLVGVDIHAGEYILFATGGDHAYFQLTKNSSGQLDSIIANGNFNSDRYITIADGQYIQFRNAYMLPIDKAPILQPTDGQYPEGMYKVGRDIAPGEYKVVSDGGDAYLEVEKDSSGTMDSIVSNDNFSGQKYITISDGQYLILKNCHIAK